MPLPKDGEQGSYVARYPAACMSLAQQGQHRCAFIDEETHVALRRGLYKRAFQGGEGTRPVPSCLQGQGAVAQYRHQWLHRQRLVDHGHALCQVLFSHIQLVALAQQVAQAEIIGETTERGSQYLWS